MDGARFRRVMALVGAALELPAHERDVWLVRECAGDEALLHEVRSLLAESDTAAGADAFEARLEQEIARVAGSITLPAPSLPSHIGPYRVVEVLGEGGMGVVYGAHQDEPLHRDVAVKVIRAGVHARGLMARFNTERRTLAALDHPHIARIHDAGTTPEGLPWFAMEWVRGEPITRYCDGRRLDITARLHLFERVLRAVEHAHQKAVVHRDLKPSNVLVTEVDDVATPKIIDFGVARVIGTLPGVTTAHTMAGSVLGTLEYMSPEQLTSAEAADTRSDIYSLGVLLYELLTGCLPLGDRLRCASPAEVERRLLDTDPAAPSRRVLAADHGNVSRAQARSIDAPGLARRLRGDLDNIVGMAMRRDPAHRYQSAGHFADDIARHLAGLPVHAHPATLNYRVRRFVRRRRGPVLAAAAVIVAVATSSALFAVRLAAERDRARLEADKATLVAEFMQDIFRQAEPWGPSGEPVTARALLDQASRNIDVELAAQPELQADMMRIMGEAYHALGIHDRALALLNAAVARHGELHGADSDEAATSRLALASLLMDTGDMADAEPLIRSALVTRQRLFGDAHPQVTAGLSILAAFQDLAGDRAAAEATLRTVLDRRAPPGRPPSGDAVSVMVRLSTLLRRDDRLDEAEAVLRAALAVPLGNGRGAQADRASALRNLAATLRDRGDYARADTLYREVIRLRRAALGDDHPEVASALNSHGLLLQQVRDFDGAIANLTEAARILEGVHPGPHPTLASVTHNLGIMYRQAGNAAESERWTLRAMDVQDRLLPPGHVDRAHPRLALAALYMDQRSWDRAEPLLREALALRRASMEPGHRRIAEVLSDLGACLTALGRYAEAEPLLLEARAALDAADSPDTRLSRIAARRLDSLYVARAQGDAAARPPR